MQVITAVAIGAVAAALYTVSPLTAWCVPLLFLLLKMAGRGLPSSERLWLNRLLVIALVARLVAMGAIFVVRTPMHDDESVAMLSGDEAYGLSRALRTRDVITGAKVTQYDYFVAYDEYGRNGYITMLAAFQILFGPTPYSMRLFNTVLFMTAAVLLFRAARSAFGSLPAFGGLTLMMFWPTLFYWSVSLLKEPLYLLFGSLALTGAIAWGRSATNRGRLLPSAAILVGLFGANNLRTEGLALLALGLVCGVTILLFFSSSGRSKLVATSVVAVLLLAVLTTAPARTRIVSGLEAAAKTHAGHVFTVGHAYKLLDAGFYVNPTTAVASTLTLTGPEAARYVIRAAISFFTVPLPWELVSTRELSYLPEQLMWYAVIVFLPAGLFVAWKRDALVTALFAGYVLPTAAVLALTNGNIGTLLRLRGTIIPYVLWISVVGFCSALQEFAPPATNVLRTATR